MKSTAIYLFIAGGFFLISSIVLIILLNAVRRSNGQRKKTRVENLFYDGLRKFTIDSIYLKDTQHRILMANDKFFKDLNRSREEVIGFNDIDFFGEEFGRATMEEEKKIFENGEPLISAVEERVVETGHRSYVLTTKVPIHKEGKVVALLGITREFTEIAKLQEELAYSATHDSLTDLCNRSAIVYELHEMLENNESVAVLFIDMDNFKHYNDGYGHDFGDELLRLVARRMESTLRKDDLIGRLSGDEFVVVLRGIQTKEEAEIATKKLITSFEAPFRTLGQSVTCSFSIGIACKAACTMKENVSVEDLIRYADHAMYEVKKSGKCGYQFYTSVFEE